MSKEKAPVLKTKEKTSIAQKKREQVWVAVYFALPDFFHCFHRHSFCNRNCDVVFKHEIYYKVRQS